MNSLSLSNMHQSPHFVLVPLFAPGHMIPMLDMARLLVERGAVVSFITTTLNASRYRGDFGKAKQVHHRAINFVELPFPCKQAGLPIGCENIDLVETLDQFHKFIAANSMLDKPLKAYLVAQQEPKPTCIITDICNPWTTTVANELGIPRLIFYSLSCLYVLCSSILNEHKIYDRVTDPFASLLVPDLPQRMEVSTAQVPGFYNTTKCLEKYCKEIWEAEVTANGVVINSFDDLEPLFAECYKKMKRNKVWTIGPVCLYNDDIARQANRGNRSSVCAHQVVAWLDSQAPNSVIYASFGSVTRHDCMQLIEIGCGLEATNRPFIWVIKEVEKSAELEHWLNDGFEARITSANKGLIIKGWAPQMVILSHHAVGGFMTHCGWNSTLEAISKGLPMITFPHFADQYMNEKLVVEELQIGIAIRVSALNSSEEQIVVKRQEIEKAVLRLMDEGKEVERRARAKELMCKARNAMTKQGSSYENVNDLIANFTNLDFQQL